MSPLAAILAATGAVAVAVAVAGPAAAFTLLVPQFELLVGTLLVRRLIVMQFFTPFTIHLLLPVELLLVGLGQLTRTHSPPATKFKRVGFVFKGRLPSGQPITLLLFEFVQLLILLLLVACGEVVTLDVVFRSVNRNRKKNVVLNPVSSLDIYIDLSAKSHDKIDYVEKTL